MLTAIFIIAALPLAIFVGLLTMVCFLSAALN
jgi:hypothetical protein